jgi:glycosyltransferase involved in cell wall biosynthesis
MSIPEISVIIPTRNRATFLADNIASLCRQSLAPERFEICIINNGSSDATAAVVEAEIRAHSRHRIFMVDEPEIGLSIARNRGVKETKAPFVAMGDDDATMPPDWCERFLSHFATRGERLAKVAGEILPVWAAPRPAWLTDGMLPLLSASTGLEPIPRFSDDPLMEGNSCYRRAALLEAGGFPRTLGRSGNQLLSGDHIVDHLMALQGWKLYYDPAIVLHHVIHADRLTPEWMRRRYFWQGVSDFAGRMYLKKMGVTINHALSLTLPLDLADWSFVNNTATPPDEAGLMKLHALGLVLALSGILPVEV